MKSHLRGSEAVYHPGMAATCRNSARTTEVGYANRNDQTVLRATNLAGTDHFQYVYVLGCGRCEVQYGANGSDIHLRRCPFCDGGRPGTAYSLMSRLRTEADWGLGAPLRCRILSLKTSSKSQAFPLVTLQKHLSLIYRMRSQLCFVLRPGVNDLSSSLV